MFKARERFHKITVFTQHDLDCALRELMDVEIHLQGDVFEISADNLCSVTLVGREDDGRDKSQTTLLLIGEPQLSARMGNDCVVQQFYMSDFINTIFVNVTLSATEPTELLFESEANINANFNVTYDISKLEVLSLNRDLEQQPLRVEKTSTAQKIWEHQYVSRLVTGSAAKPPTPKAGNVSPAT